LLLETASCKEQTVDAELVKTGPRLCNHIFIERNHTMKTAIYIEDGVVQLVITPESEFEKNALTSFEDRPLDTKIFHGSFYDCRGGWVRQEEYWPEVAWQTRRDGRSIILTIKESKPKVEGSKCKQSKQ
jgi:hypothetical protein